MYSDAVLKQRQTKIDSGGMCPLAIADDKKGQLLCQHQNWDICSARFALQNCPIFADSPIAVCPQCLDNVDQDSGNITFKETVNIAVSREVVQTISKFFKAPLKLCTVCEQSNQQSRSQVA